MRAASSGLLLLSASSLAASGSTIGPNHSEPNIPFEKYQLENGLTVILHSDRRLPLAAVSVWYHVGALEEPTGRSGFAHLFEHMMFQGTPHTGEDMHFRRLQEVGATNINGTTDFDRTNYFETVPSNELSMALWLESERMGFLLDALTKKSLDNQIEVVKNERRQSIENAPYGLMEEAITQNIYPKTHPYYGNVIGSMADISAAKVEDVQDFFKTYYSPANATLGIAGDIDIAATKALIQKYFGSLHGRPAPAKVSVPYPMIAGEKIIHFDEPVANQAKIAIVWVGPPFYSADSAALDLAAHVISGVRSSRLDKAVTYDKLIAESVTTRFEEREAGSLFSIELIVRPDHTLAEAQTAIDKVLASFQAHPPTTQELTRALNAEETSLVSSLELLGGHSGRIERLQFYNHYLKDPGKLQWDMNRYRQVTTKDVARVISKYLNHNRLIVLATPSGQSSPKAAVQ